MGFYRKDSDEEPCNAVLDYQGREVACLRTKGHSGRCEAWAGLAGEMDGVCWECREPLGSPHRSDCGAITDEEWLDAEANAEEEKAFESADTEEGEPF